jgi:hypothetical protein
MCIEMDAKYVTYNFLMAPTNIAGVLSNKIATKDYDPTSILLFNALNSLITSSFIYAIFHVFHDKYFGFVITGMYLLLTTLIGLMVGTVDQAFFLMVPEKKGDNVYMA